MNEDHGYRVLVLDDHPGALEDYEAVLCRTLPSIGPDGLKDLGDEIKALVGPPEGFPTINLELARSFEDAVSALQGGVSGRPNFALAFVEADLRTGPLGPEKLSRIRQIAPSLQIVLATASEEVDPYALSQLVPPVDRIHFLRKPFSGREVRQLALGLGSRWRSEQNILEASQPEFEETGRRKPDFALWSVLPYGLLLFDRHDSLVRVNKRTHEVMPELADLYVPGASYGEIQQAMAARCLAGINAENEEDWLRDRLAWHAKSGGLSELSFKPDRWFIWAEETGSTGDTYCAVSEITALRQATIEKSRRVRMTQTARGLVALMSYLVTGSAVAGPKAAGLLETLSADGPGDHQFDKIAGRMQSIASQIRDTAGLQVLKPEVSNLEALCSAVIQARKKGAERFEVVSNAGLWPVSIDHKAFVKAIQAVLDHAESDCNAADRITIGIGNTRVTSDRLSGPLDVVPGDYVRCAVRHPGPGVATEERERALSPFGRIELAPDGGGMGLCVVQGFVAQTGGTMTFEQGPGEGYTVCLYFGRHVPPPDSWSSGGGQVA